MHLYYEVGIINRVTLVILSEAKNLCEDNGFLEILRFAQNDMDRDIFQRKFALPDYLFNLHYIKRSDYLEKIPTH